jgi:hypothetical protein
MDDDKDDKNLIEKTIEVVKEIAHTASEAAKHAMEPEPIKPGDEVVYLPATGTGIMGDSMMPPFVVIPRRKKVPRKTAKNLTKKAAKKSAKKIATKSGKKSAAKKRKPPAKAAAPKKTKGKKAVKKTKAKKSKR